MIPLASLRFCLIGIFVLFAASCSCSSSDSGKNNQAIRKDLSAQSHAKIEREDSEWMGCTIPLKGASHEFASALHENRPFVICSDLSSGSSFICESTEEIPQQDDDWLMSQLPVDRSSFAPIRLINMDYDKHLLLYSDGGLVQSSEISTTTSMGASLRLASDSTLFESDKGSVWYETVTRCQGYPAIAYAQIPRGDVKISILKSDRHSDSSYWWSKDISNLGLDIRGDNILYSEGLHHGTTIAALELEDYVCLAYRRIDLLDNDRLFFHLLSSDSELDTELCDEIWQGKETGLRAALTQGLGSIWLAFYDADNDAVTIGVYSNLFNDSRQDERIHYVRNEWLFYELLENIGKISAITFRPVGSESSASDRPVLCISDSARSELIIAELTNDMIDGQHSWSVSTIDRSIGSPQKLEWLVADDAEFVFYSTFYPKKEIRFCYRFQP